MNNPLVSIIVPVYNVQNSVARCLESICAQTWKDIEVILVNDGSRDESFSICEQFREKDPASFWWTNPIPVCRRPATAACPLQGASMCSLWTATIISTLILPSGW